MATALKTSQLVNRNVTSLSGRTSMRMEPEVWSALEEICHRENMTLAELVQQIEAGKPHDGGRTSAVRVWVLAYFRKAATDEGHRAVGHGMLDQVVDTGWRPSAERLSA